MTNANYIDSTYWVIDPTTEVTCVHFTSLGEHYYKIGFGSLYGGIVTPSIAVLESIQDAVGVLIAAYEQHQTQPAENGDAPAGEQPVAEFEL